MERIGILINKLQEQWSQKADVQNMLVTAQMLETELQLNSQQSVFPALRKVAVLMPHNLLRTAEALTADALTRLPAKAAAETTIPEEFYKPVVKQEPDPTPVIEEPASEPEPLPNPEPIPLPEPEPIPHFVEEKAWQRLFVDNDEPTSPWHIDPMMEIPTLAHQEKVVFELNDLMVEEGNASLNDTLKQESNEVATKLQDTPVKDLRKAVSINDRHRFIHELFRDDETMYERSIKTINGFHIFAEAEFWIQRELKVKLGWDTSLELVKVFDQVVKRRFA